MTTATIEQSRYTQPSTKSSAPPPEKALTLALRLAHAEHALLTLTSGQVDAIVNPSGQTYLLRPAQENLRRSERRLQSVIESLADVIVVVDRGGAILSINAAAHRVLGRAPEKLVESCIFDLVHEEDLPRMYSAFLNVSEGLLETATAQFRHETPDGSIRLIEATVGKMHEASPPSVVFSLRVIAYPLHRRDFLLELRPHPASPDREAEFVEPTPPVASLTDAASMERQVVLSALEAMEASCFTALALFYRDRLSYQKIADELEIPVGTVTSLMAQGEAFVRQRSEQFWAGTADAEHVQREAVSTEASQDKDRFLAMLAHELRAPLTPVLFAVEDLHEDERFIEARPTLGMMRRNLQVQARLIDELNYFTALGQHKVRLHLESVDVHEAIGFVLEICRSELVAAQIEVLLDLRAEQKLVEADSVRLQQVMWNLVKNAVKFSPPGSRIFITSANDSLGGVTIEFADSGVGIEPELLPLVFGAYQQGDRAMQQLHGGLGLGLFIARGLAEAQGGDLAVFSEGRGKGAMFRLTLPNAPANAS